MVLNLTGLDTSLPVHFWTVFLCLPLPVVTCLQVTRSILPAGPRGPLVPFVPLVPLVPFVPAGPWGPVNGGSTSNVAGS